MKALKFRVLDEADEMLNMGFVDDVETILGKFLFLYDCIPETFVLNNETVSFLC